MKKLISISIIAMCVLCALSGICNAAPSANINYHTDYGEVTITSVTPADITELEIPSEIKGCPVTAIDEYAFGDNTELKSVTIPSTVKIIGKDAFSSCKKLERVFITDVGSWCNIDFSTQLSNPLYYAKRLYLHSDLVTDLVIPLGVTSVSRNAFINCSVIKSVNVPSTCTLLNDYAFKNCTGINKVYVSNLSAWCAIEFGDETSNPLYYADELYVNDTLVSDLIIPSGVTTIGKDNFRGCKNLLSVTVPSSVESIGVNAFRGCVNLKDVKISNGTKSIGEEAFYGCTSLKYVDLPDSISSIGESAFYSCSNLKSIAIPSGVSTIQNDTFSYSGLNSVYLPTNVMYITDGAFKNTDISDVYYQGSEAFADNITILGNNDSLKNTNWIYNSTKSSYLNSAKDIFKDVPSDSWYKEYVDYSVSNGIFNGTSSTTFAPLMTMTRSQFVQVLANVSGVNTSNRYVSTSFTDVPSGKWFAPAVKWASENGIVNGTGNGKFSPNNNISREDMCLMLVRYASYKNLNLRPIKNKTVFADDSKIGSWAKDAVYTCQMAEIVGGKGNNKFDPKATGSRAEAATIFTRFHKNYLSE